MRVEEKTEARYGLIAGSGQFPLLVLEAARCRGIEMVVAAIREEASPEVAARASRLHWLGLGELSRLIAVFRQEGVNRAIMAGKVRHDRIFSSIRPDWKLVKVLAALPRKNTDSLIGAVAKVLEEEGIHLEDSTHFLEPLLAPAGVLTRRGPDSGEQENIAYGRKVAHGLAQWDIGQTVVIAERACVAVEAMEGTDAAIRRAAQYAQGKPLTVVKVSKPQQDMRFDVPVTGPGTVRVMQEAGATALCMDAGKTLIFDREEMLAVADAAGIAIVGMAPDEPR